MFVSFIVVVVREALPQVFRVGDTQSFLVVPGEQEDCQWRTQVDTCSEAKISDAQVDLQNAEPLTLNEV